MKTWGSALILLTFTFSLFAQEQLALRLNEKGLLKILEMAVKYNTSAAGSKTVLVPGKKYKFTLKKELFLSNPIVPIVNEVSNLELNKDLDFYLNTADIKITGNVDSKSIKTSMSGSHKNGFDLHLTMNIPSINAYAGSMVLCEDPNHCKDKKTGDKDEDEALKAIFSSLSIKTQGAPTTLSIILKVLTDNQTARVKVVSVTSNIESEQGPGLDINIAGLEVPPVFLVVNGQETKIDTSDLRNQLLKRKDFLAKKLMAFAADFIASDLAEMINVYLVPKHVSTAFEVYHRDAPIRFDEFLSRYPVARDATYVKLPLTPKKSPDIMEQIANIIRQAQVDLSLARVSTPLSKDLELHGAINMILNQCKMGVGNTLGNSKKPLPKLDLSAYRNSDINLAISEPLINGVLDLASSTGLFKEVFASVAKLPHFSISTVKTHFTADNNIVLVVNAAIDLKRLQNLNDPFSSPKKWVTKGVKNQITAFLERNNNNSIIYFPLEIEIAPNVRTLPSGGVGLNLSVQSPFNSAGVLINRFKYPSNISQMTNMVYEGLMDDLKSSFAKFVPKNYPVDLTKFLNQQGVEFTPRNILVNQGAYLLLNLDIKDIKFNSKNPGNN